MRSECKDAAMTFEEIARRMGLTRQDIRGIYERGMAKIRRNPRLMEELRGAAAFHESSKPQQRVYPDWVRE
jgi:DNA-directed RNA polymerase sigma subunit (sigma70/sigma32)